MMYAQPELLYTRSTPLPILTEHIEIAADASFGTREMQGWAEFRIRSNSVM